MRKDPTEFRKRFQRWKQGDTVYEAGLPKLGDGTVDWDRWDNATTTSYSVPFIKDKAVRLTNAGNATGAVLSTNLLDSIADNAARAGLPLETALGLAVKESTLGNPTDTRSAWNLSSGIRRQFNGVYPGTNQHINRGEDLNERDIINYHKGHSFDQLPYIELKDANENKSILQEAFEFYGQHPDRYNSRQKNHQQLVNKAGKAVMQSPEVQAWQNSRQTKTTKDSQFVQNLKKNKGFQWKLPKFADGTEGRSYGYQTEDKHPIKFDEQGNLVDQITGDVGTMRLPEVQVSTANPKNYRSSYDPNIIGNILLDKARQFIYNRVDPYSYNIGDAISQLFYKGRNTNKDDIYDALWARYLNRTNKQAGYDIDSYLQPAVYNLTKGKPVGKLYRLTSKAWKGNDDQNPLGDRQLYEMLKSGKKSDFGDGVGSTMTGLGIYTRSLGEDEKGKYMSYYDEWDISPIGNKSGKNGKDQTMGIGTPFSVYDRRYYTDEEAQHILSEYDKFFQSITDLAKNQSIKHEIYSPKPYKIKK